MDTIPHLMSSKGLVFLKTLIKSKNLNILFVVSERDNLVQNDYYDEIEKLCKANSIQIYNRQEDPKIPPNSIVLAVSWKWIINYDNSKVIVFHDSLLPKLRGFNPLVTALINGHKEIGVTAFYASAEFDRGEIISQSKTLISYPIKIEKAIELIHKNYIELANFISDFLNSGQLPASKPQLETEATYSLWRNEYDYFIDWNLSSNEIKRFIDAVGFPYKGAASYLNKEKIRILEAKELYDVRIENRTPGKIIFIKNKLPVVVCGKGLLLIVKLEDDCGKSLLPLAKLKLQFKS